MQEKIQSIITQDIHKKEIAKITKHTEKVIMTIQQHEKQIQFDKMKMSDQKIALKSD